MTDLLRVNEDPSEVRHRGELADNSLYWEESGDDKNKSMNNDDEEAADDVSTGVEEDSCDDEDEGKEEDTDDDEDEVSPSNGRNESYVGSLQTA